MRRVVEEHRRALAVAEVLQVRGRLAVGDHQHHRLGVGVPAQMPGRQRQRVMQVGALLVDALQPGQLGGGHGAGVAAERDDLQRIRAEPGAHQVVQRQRRALHRQPAVLHHHRERRVHQQRHRGLGAGLGLGDLDVVDGDPHRTPFGDPPVPRLRAAPHWSACG